MISPPPHPAPPRGEVGAARSIQWSLRPCMVQDAKEMVAWLEGVDALPEAGSFSVSRICAPVLPLKAREALWLGVQCLRLLPLRAEQQFQIDLSYHTCPTAPSYMSNLGENPFKTCKGSQYEGYKGHIPDGHMVPQSKYSMAQCLCSKSFIGFCQKG